MNDATMTGLDRLFVRLPVIAAASAIALSPALVTAAEDPGLLGCWRGQHMQVSFANRAPRDQNGDCVLEYGTAIVHSRCHGTNAQGAITDSDRVYAYEVTGPGRLRLTPVDAVTGKPTGAPTGIDYRIDGKWLITTQRYDTPPTAMGERPERVTNLSAKIDVARDNATACKPRGDTGLRIGRTPVSSLSLSLPAGWEPLLVDPATDKQLASAVYTGFLVGAFVPRAANKSSIQRTRFVLVVDDARYGPSPVREAEFVDVKRRFVKELGDARPTCDLGDRVCAVLRLPQGGLVYTELFNVNGRVAMVSSTSTSEGAEVADALRGAVKAFVDQLRRDNP